MPLIIVTGLPTSGKTTRAKQLQAYLASRLATESPSHRLHYVSDTTLSISRTVYDLSPSQLPAHTRSANASEKDARAALASTVKRLLSDRDIVILDNANYIKGWRYQLYCEARAVRTPSVVLQIGCSVEKAREVNEERLRRRKAREEASTGRAAPEGESRKESSTTDELVNNVSSPEENKEQERTSEEDGQDEEPYEPANWDNLVFRYEEPNPMNRWDSPLFTLIWEDDAPGTRATFDRLWEAIAGTARPVVKPTTATVSRTRDVGTDYLYILERETQDIVRRILDQQGEGDDGGEVVIPASSDEEGAGKSTSKSKPKSRDQPDEELVVHLPAGKVGLPQLQRMRRAFVGMSRGGIGLEKVGDFGVRRARASFVGYLNDAFEREG